MRLELLKMSQDLLLANDASGASIDESAEGATKLVEVSRPAQRRERCSSGRRQSATNLPGPTNLGERGVNDGRHIHDAIAKRWNVDPDPLQPPIQLGPEAALVNVGLERRSRG